jgi:DNA-binding XRE family transcriptional regulator
LVILITFSCCALASPSRTFQKIYHQSSHLKKKKVVRRGFLGYALNGCQTRNGSMTAGQQRKNIETAETETDHSDVLIGARLRHMRIASGLKLKDVAAAADCSESMLSKIETGHVSPSINMLHRITKVLNVNISGLFAPMEGDVPLHPASGNALGSQRELHAPRAGPGLGKADSA